MNLAIVVAPHVLHVEGDDLPIPDVRALVDRWFTAIAQSSGSADRKLDQLLAQGAALLMANAETKAIMTRIDTATTGIASRITALIAKIGTGMTQAEVDEVNQGLGAEATRLEGIAVDPDNPLPAVPA